MLFRHLGAFWRHRGILDYLELERGIKCALCGFVSFHGETVDGLLLARILIERQMDVLLLVIV